MFEKLLQRVSRVFKLARRNVSRCYFAPDLVLRMCGIARDYVLEVLNRIGVTFLLPCDAAQLVTRIDLTLVDLKGAFETFARLIEFAEQHQIPIAKDKRGDAPFSIDANLLHSSSEGKVLEDPAVEPPAYVYQRTVAPEDYAAVR